MTATDESVDVTVHERPRRQHVIPASLVLALTLGVAWLSFTREPADAFLFPRLIGSVMLVLALWNFIRAVSGLSRVGDGLALSTAKNIAPGVVVILLLVLLAAKTLGFYTASFIAFLVLHALYDPAPLNDAGVWIRRLIVAVVFMAIIYALFTLLLKVQLPRGHFF